MGLFQKTVLKKHLLELNNSKIDAAYKRFTDYFHNPTIQNNIRNSKEEQFQEGFLRELFGHVLNYTLNPNPEFNLTTELKNTTDSKKVDGAIVIDDIVRAVIELKGMDTTDLDKWVDYAFRYKNSHQDCTYVVLSNFEKLRFYIDNTIEYEEFNLFTLNREQFNLLYMCLSYDNIKHNVPKRLKAESVSQEDQITKKLYKDYSEFKRALFNNLVELNPQYDKLLLFKKTQKLLDRFLFIFFAEDRLLLPTNLIFRINQEWKNLQAMRIPVSLYERYMVYFNDLNHGAKVTLPAFGKKTGEAITAEFEIFAYNGGLFLPDEVLDNVKIDDTLLHTYSEKLSHYDFDSDVDVNILGHIFENSLNEIDEIKSEIEGEVIDRTKTRRKKDGVFYTPKYITKYIVDNTVGKLCEEKKAELKLEDEDYINDKKLQTKTKKALLDKLSDYRNYLLDLTICDPACGSGAFLNQALEFLITEHRYIDELQAKLMGDAMILSDVETSILENNIYGVDLNDESVEIAKLSLWLRTAQKGRKLNSLNNNIKCGNSLIDDPAIAGDKAFSWDKEFPEVFAKGGFDVVIGNPPYGMDSESKHKLFYKSRFKLLEGRYDLFELFVECSLNLFKKNGFLSFIIPNTILSNLYSKELRKYIASNLKIIEIVNFGMDVFEDPTVHTCILTLAKKTEIDFVKIRKQVEKQNELEIDYDYKLNQQELLSSKNYTYDIFFNPKEKSLFDKINKGIPLGDTCYIRQCIKTGNDPVFVMNSQVKPDEPWKPALRGKGMNRYAIIENDLYLKYGDWLARNWKNKTFYETPKIIVRETGNRITATVDFNNHYLLSSLYSIYPKQKSSHTAIKALLAILNSRLATFFIMKIAFELTKGAFTKVRTNQLARLPIVNHEIVEDKLAIKVDFMIQQTENMRSQINKFTYYLEHQFNTITLTRNLYSWNELTFVDFIKELNKAMIISGGASLSKLQEMEWMEVFETKKKEALELKAEIEWADKEIDRLVYELYGLSEEEIKIVEG